MRPLRPGEHRGLVGLEQEVGEIAALFHGVGAVGHHDAGDVVARQLLIDPARQPERELGRHVEAGHGGEVVDLERRDLGELRHLSEQVLAALRGDRAAELRIVSRGDRAAGADQDDFGRHRRGG